MTAKKDIKKVVLAYSGGLDTSVILKWLQVEYGCEVVTFTADLGQGEELEPARRKAERAGIKEIYIEDVREEFVRDFVFPMFRANAVYEGLYLLGTSIARPLIAKRLVEIAAETGADAIAHGATGKGNDQVRFELNAYALNPDIHVIAPWRDWDLNSREKLIDWAEKHQIEIPKDKRGEAPFSVDANLLHTSSEGKVLEDPAVPAPDYVYQRTVDPEDAPDKPEVIEIGFDRGDAISINGKPMSPATLLTELNEYGRKHGIGRLDLVENRFVGMKSRGIYETPGGTILLAAHRGIEQITLDRGAGHLKDELMPRYAELIYNGFWFAPEREMLQAAIDKSQERVSGTVMVKLYKGSANVIGRSSPNTIYSEAHVTFEEDMVYDQKDAEGFIKLNALRLKLLARRNMNGEQSVRLLAIVLLSFVTSHAAVAAGFVIPNSETHEVKSEILARSYDVYVKTPRGYDDPENAGKKYPVIYLNDGPYTFQVASGVTRIPINSGKFEGAILVGMSFAHGEQPMVSRTRDLTPTVAEDWKNQTGGAEAYLSFLREEVFPFVESAYRADPERRVLSGLSFGGLFGVYVLLTEPETFDAYILTSPSLWFDDKVMFRMEEAYAAEKKDLKAKVYMATGDQERPHLATINDLVADQNEFAARLRSRAYPSLILRDEIIPDALHETAFPIGFTRGAQWLFYKGEE